MQDNFFYAAADPIRGFGFLAARRALNERKQASEKRGAPRGGEAAGAPARQRSAPNQPQAARSPLWGKVGKGSLCAFHFFFRALPSAGCANRAISAWAAAGARTLAPLMKYTKQSRALAAAGEPP